MPVFVPPSSSGSGGPITGDQLPIIPDNKLPASVVFESELTAAINGLASTTQPLDTELSTIAGLTPIVTGDMLVGQGGVWSKKTLEQVKALLGAGTSRPAPLLIFDGAMAARATTPARIVFTGSSTTAGSNASAPTKRWVNLFMSYLQALYPSGTGSEPPTLADTNGAFGTITPLPGVQGFNIGQGGTNSSTFLTDAESQIIASLDPSLIVYMVGSNDLYDSRSVATFKADLQSRINYTKARLTRRPCAHLIVFPYERWDVTRSIAWADYGVAMAEIAAASPTDTLFDSLNERYVAFKIPGARGLPGGAGAPDTDPNGLIASDKIHQNDTGHEQMARWIFQDVTNVAPPTVTPNPGNGDGGGSTAGPVTDNFNRTSTTTLGSAITGQTWSVNNTTWVTDGSVAYMSAGTNGLATIPCGYSDVTFSCKVRRPQSGSAGVRVRQSDGVNTGLALYYSAADNLILLGTVINGVISNRASIAIPAEISVGTYANLTISANGPDIIGYVNDVAVVNTTLTSSDLAALTGTSIALRQTGAGIAFGAFEDASAAAFVPVVPVTVLASDTFTRTGSALGTADQGGNWSLEQGAFATNGTRAYPTTVPAVASLGTGGLRNGRVIMETTMPTTNGFNLVFGRGVSTTHRIGLTVNGSTGNLELSTVIASTSTTKATVAIPGGAPAAGTLVTLMLEMNELTITGYWNGVAVPGLTFTLTSSEDAALTNTRAGFRINGATNATTSGIESFTVQAIASSGTTDSAIMPTGDVVSNGRTWRTFWSNDFNTTFAKGAARSTYGSSLFGYDGSTDTSNWGTYNSDKTISGVAGAISGTTGQGVLVLEPYYESGVNKFWQAALTPPGSSNTGTSQWGVLSGRTSIRMRIINNVKGNYTKSDGTTGQDTGCKFVDLDWPAVVKGNLDPNGVTIIDSWDYGELNGPEGNTAGVPEGFAHFATGSAGSRNHGNALAFSYGVPFSEWHTYTREWVAGQYVRYYLDGVLVKQAPASGIPFVKMYRSFRTETWLNVSIRPPEVGTCRVEIDWAVSQYLVP